MAKSERKRLKTPTKGPTSPPVRSPSSSSSKFMTSWLNSANKSKPSQVLNEEVSDDEVIEVTPQETDNEMVSDSDDESLDVQEEVEGQEEEATQTLEPFDEQRLIKKAKQTAGQRLFLPLNTLEELRQQCTAHGLRFRIPDNWPKTVTASGGKNLDQRSGTSKKKRITKKQKTKKKKNKMDRKEDEDVIDTGDDNENEPKKGEYKVERIKDADVSTEQKLIYEVKWQGYDEVTWESAINVSGCKQMVADFREMLTEMTPKEEAREEDFVKLAQVIEDICSPSFPDIYPFVKLNGVKLKDYEASKDASLKKRVKDNCNLVLNWVTHRKAGKFYTRDLSQRQIMSIIKRRLHINQAFGSFERFYESLEERKSYLRVLRVYETGVNALIGTDGPPLQVENLVDMDQPDQFNYTSKYVPVDVLYQEDPPLHCECDDCGSSKKCCPQTSGSLKPYTKDGTLKVDFRTPIYECNKNCKCGPECEIRVVQKGPKVKVIVFKTDNGRGWGLKAAEAINKGTFIGTYLGELITMDEADRRGSVNGVSGRDYTFDLDFNPGQEALFAVDARLYGNFTRFINHSCEPNLGLNAVWSEALEVSLPTVAMFTKRHIRKGEELTFDYKMKLPEGIDDEEEEEDQESNGSPSTDRGVGDNVSQAEDNSVEEPSQSSQQFKCMCGAASCRGTLY